MSLLLPLKVASGVLQSAPAAVAASLSRLRAGSPSPGLAFGSADFLVVIGNVQRSVRIFSSSSSSWQGFARKSSAPL